MLKSMSLLPVGGLLVLLPMLCSGEDRPLAPWGIHTIVSTGPKTYEGEKIRAILVYGEIGNPEITIESIRVEMGYPDSSEVIWRTRIDIAGEEPDSCPLAETYCAIVENLRWSDNTLHYDLIAPSATLRCRVEGVKSQAPKTTCKNR